MARDLAVMLTIILCPAFTSISYGQVDGKALFTQNCTACHTIGQGQLVGPDLKGVQSKYEEEWLVKFIRSSQALVNDGDQRAVAIFEEFNMIPMPDQPFGDEEISSILAYIETESVTEEVAPIVTGEAPEKSTSNEVVQELKNTDSWMQGNTPLVIIIFGLEFALAVILITIIVAITVMKRRL